MILPVCNMVRGSPRKELPVKAKAKEDSVLKLKKQLAERWFVYILRCADSSLYTGIAKDVDRRLQKHNAGTASRYIPQPNAGRSEISGRTNDQGQGVEARVGYQSPVTEGKRSTHPVREVAVFMQDYWRGGHVHCLTELGDVAGRIVESVSEL